MSNTCTDSAVHSREGRLPASDVVPSAEMEVCATELEVAGVELEVSATELEVAGVELEVVTTELELSATELELFADELEVAGVELELRARELDETAPYSYAPRSGDLPTNGIPTSVPRSIIWLPLFSFRKSISGRLPSALRGPSAPANAEMSFPVVVRLGSATLTKSEFAGVMFRFQVLYSPLA